MSIRSKLSALLLLVATTAQADADCTSAAQCNQLGSAAYQAGRYAQAIEAFERQVRRVEEGDTAQLELALNNLILTHLRAGDPGMARAWLGVALDNHLSGPSTRLHLGKVAAALDYPALGASPVGRYLRYGGQAVWSELQISAQPGGGYRASFSPLRAGARVEEYGPAAIGELEGKLVGDGIQMTLEDAGLGADCAVQLLREGIELRVLEVFGDGCQDYGGMGISVAGRYLKVATQVRP
ncbi:tetratricopeptide repeat protein [Ectopseudomonas hydrolytica]|uniref:Tetratricopeptide repeat protein n=1 Tax=Ectopseudomonas hydrolytica TaxID=2493633 RepID=A0ABY5A7Z1_9GAMM|nr:MULTISPECIES: tetratricopeptide repeat protein [Pseudomonas]MDH0098563.1 tetratricopeptide repeat protein [Pseudomonas sp. GD04158]USR39768.1 tetratricopeptide repeat protein [Pseudomonas hydrolytica]